VSNLQAILRDVRFWMLAAVVACVSMVALAAGGGTFVYGDVVVDMSGECAPWRERALASQASNLALAEAFGKPTPSQE